MSASPDVKGYKDMSSFWECVCMEEEVESDGE